MLWVSILSASLGKSTDWNYRIFDRRTISIKGKNEEVRKLATIDLQTNIPFSIEVPKEISLETLEVEKTYYVSLKVYTARDTPGITPDLTEFFQVLDVDQSMEDFIKTYWLYPKLIKFELVEAELL
jgi:hypothetical protein